MDDIQTDFNYPETESFQRIAASWKSRGLPLTDWHIHLRGGMTAEKAALRQERSGINSAILENHGREWPLSDNAKLESFIEESGRAKAAGHALPVGIQANDRDWFKQISPALRKRLDFVLADTMIMDTNAEGKPQRLWLPDVAIEDPESWMGRYLAHNLAILDEPVSILANPTYLPPCIAALYDQLWTDERMEKVIGKAVEKGIALEVQAESLFPRARFLLMAKKMGALFSFGTNNFTAAPKDLTRWTEAIELLDLQPADLWRSGGA